MQYFAIGWLPIHAQFRAPPSLHSRTPLFRRGDGSQDLRHIDLIPGIQSLQLEKKSGYGGCGACLYVLNFSFSLSLSLMNHCPTSSIDLLFVFSPLK